MNTKILLSPIWVLALCLVAFSCTTSAVVASPTNGVVILKQQIVGVPNILLRDALSELLERTSDQFTPKEKKSPSERASEINGSWQSVYIYFESFKAGYSATAIQRVKPLVDQLYSMTIARLARVKSTINPAVELDNNPGPRIEKMIECIKEARTDLLNESLAKNENVEASGLVVNAKPRAH